MLMPTIFALKEETLRSLCDEQGRGWVCREVYDRTESRALATVADWTLGKPLTIIFILILAWLANRLGRRVVKRALRGLSSGGMKERMGAVRRRTPNALLETQEVSLRATQRIDAMTTVLRSVVTGVVAMFTALLVLGQLGIDLAPLLAGAGVLGVALGFGAQTMVKDFLSGAFILIEDQFGVGDIVDMNTGVAGVVEAVSLRTTRLRAVDGTVWHVANGDIRAVGNRSQLWSRAVLDISVAYSTDVAAASRTIKRVADEIWRSHKEVLEEPELWGVEAFQTTGVVIRLVAKTTPADQFDIARLLRERIKEAFDREGIEMANVHGGAMLEAEQAHVAATAPRPTPPPSD